jgi:hypothetical protein
MPELDQAIIGELSRMAVAPVSPAELSGFISRRIIRPFAATYHIVWLVKEGLVYPSLYSLDDDLISNLYTQQLIKTSYKLNDGIWDKLWKGNKPAVINLPERMIGKTVPEWVPLLISLDIIVDSIPRPPDTPAHGMSVLVFHSFFEGGIVPADTDIV